jgi:6-phosphogluconolactonase/glucosamine-6-phosphate isomerase/deaminase
MIPGILYRFLLKGTQQIKRNPNMKWHDIILKYKDEWVLLEVKKADKNLTIKEGKVLSHSKDKNEIYNRLLTLKPKSFAIEYTGKIPDDLSVVLFEW